MQERESDPSGEDQRHADERRAALVSILEKRAGPIVDRVVADALRATDFVGLGRGVAERCAQTGRAVLPVCLDALGAPDPERDEVLDQGVHAVQDLIRQGVPTFVQRSLVSLGFRAATGVARDNARLHGFEPDELEDELRVYQRAFEARMFFRARR